MGESSSSNKRPGRKPYPDRLTPAEWRIAQAAVHGLTNAAIAKRLGISLNAVKYHLQNILNKLGVKNKRALRLWFAVPAQSALQHATKQSYPESTAMNQRVVDNSENMLGAIGQLSRNVRDIKEAEAWYRDVLGLTHLFTYDKLAFFDCGGVRLFLSQENAKPTEESIIYWRVADIELVCQQLSARGVIFTQAPHLIHKHQDGTEEWMAFFSDPEGRPLAIMAQVK